MQDLAARPGTHIPAAITHGGVPPDAPIPRLPASMANPGAMAAALAWLNSTGPMAQPAAQAVAFGSAISLATLFACFAASALFQRHLARQVQTTLAGMEMVNADMRDAANAARESASALSRLAGAVLGAEEPLRGWAQSAMAGQENAKALAQSCAELTSTLPALLPHMIADALAVSQASSRDALEQAAARLDRHAIDISAAADAVRHGGQAIASAAYNQANQQHVATLLARQCEAAIARVPDAVAEAVAAVQASGRAALDAAAPRLAAGARGIEDAPSPQPSAPSESASGTAGHGALHESAARLVERCDTAAQALPAAIGGAIDAVEQRGKHHTQRINERLQDSALCLEAAAAEMQCGLRAASEAQAAHTAALERAVQQAGGFVSLLPEITASLASGTAAIRREVRRGAQTLAESAAQVGRAALAVDAAASAARAGAVRLGDAALAQDGAATRIEAGLNTLARAATAPDEPPATLASAPLHVLDLPPRARAPLARIDDLLAQTASFLSEAAALAPPAGDPFAATQGDTDGTPNHAAEMEAGTRRPAGAAPLLARTEQAGQAAA